MKKDNVECIKSDCQFYREHNFRISYFLCILINESFQKNSVLKCAIPDVIENTKKQVDTLSKYYENVVKGKIEN